MGAHDYIVTIKETDKAKVRERWKQIQEDDLFEHGHDSYNGSSTTMHGSITFYDRRLATENEAREFCLDKHEKWTGAVAVSYYLPAKQGERDKARIEKAEAKWKQAYEKGLALVDQANDGVRNRKSKMIGCGNCGSKLSKEHYLKHPGLPLTLFDGPGFRASAYTCSVCHTPMLSESMMKRINAHKVKIEAAQRALQEARKPKPSKEIAWAVGGWAAS